MIRLIKNEKEVILNNPKISEIESYIKNGYTVIEYIIRGDNSEKE